MGWTNWRHTEEKVTRPRFQFCSILSFRISSLTSKSLWRSSEAQQKTTPETVTHQSNTEPSYQHVGKRGAGPTPLSLRPQWRAPTGALYTRSPCPECSTRQSRCCSTHQPSRYLQNQNILLKTREAADFQCCVANPPTSWVILSCKTNYISSLFTHLGVVVAPPTPPGVEEGRS